MEILKEAKNVVDFASYYPLLNKATQDNDSPTPGYMYQEIIKLSHHSPGHRQLLIDFLFSRLNGSSWPGKQKVVRIFQHLCTKGHRGVRVSLRGQDGELRRVAAVGGPPDPLLANTPQLFLSSAIQELLTQLFDSKTMKEDELWLAGKGRQEESSSNQGMTVQGYGSQGTKGKYEGFGSCPNAPSESLVTQVRGMVERVMSASGDSYSLDLLKSDKGDYQPVSLPSLTSLPPVQATHRPHIQVLSASQKTKYKAHRRGRAGGGWDSDEEEQQSPSSSLVSEVDHSLASPSTQTSSESQTSGGSSEDQLLNALTDSKVTWPLDHDTLVQMSRECATLNLTLLLEKISNLCSDTTTTTTTTTTCTITSTTTPITTSTTTVTATTPITASTPLSGRSQQQLSGSTMDESFITSLESPQSEVNEPQFIPDHKTTRLLALLLLVEFGMHYDVLPPQLVHFHLGQILHNMHENKCLGSAVRLKARKLSLITSKLV